MKRYFCLLLAVCLLILPVGARASGVLYGDVNGDGSVNAKDATLILRYSVGKLADLSKFDMVAANVNADGQVNAKDATMILRYSVKKLDIFPAESHEHSYTDKVTKEATCTEDGVKTFSCSCGDSYTETITKTGHSYSSKVTAPTCDKGGYTTYTCRSCGDSYTGDETDALGHKWGDWVRTKEPTTSAEGEDTRECSRCGKTETRAVDKLPEETEPETGCTSHSWGNWTSDANGSYGSCTNCGQSITIDGSGSNYSDEAARLINEYRVSQGLPELTIVNEKTGLIRAQELTIEFAHNRLNGKHNAMYSEWYGENCAAGFNSANAAVQAWINSDGHREAMLREKWTKICVAYNGTYWVTLFG